MHAHATRENPIAATISTAMLTATDRASPRSTGSSTPYPTIAA